LPHKKPSINFEKAMQELEALVERMEHGDLPLEESLKLFERGTALTRACQAALQKAEQKVEILTTRNGRESVEPFEQDGDSNEGH
jgi:exodeoxyribonuclease VII small subunit